MLVPMVTLVNVMMEALTQRTGFSASGPQFRSEDVFKIIIHSHSQWYRTCFKKMSLPSEYKKTSCICCYKACIWLQSRKTHAENV